MSDTTDGAADRRNATDEYELLVFSDSHGRADLIREALAAHPHADVIHLGDGLEDLSFISLGNRRKYCVRGNYEDCLYSYGSRADAPPPELMLEIRGVKLLLSHGHRIQVKYDLDSAATYAAARGADILLFGHTHKMCDIYLPSGAGSESDGTPSRPLRLFNPGTAGACTVGGSRSYGLITFRNGEYIASHAVRL